MKINVLAAGVLTAALAGLLFGFDTAVISGVTGTIKAVFGLSDGLLGLTVSAALWGTLAGALTVGPLGDRFGSRDCLKVMAALYLISGIGCALSWNLPSLVVFRFIGGLGIGGSSVLAPVYIAEIAPSRWRGLLVGLFQFNIVLGILVAYFSNFVIGSLGLGDAEWRWKLGASAIPAAALLALLHGIVHSPRWLAAQGRLAEALSVLRRIGVAAPEAELQSITHALAVERAASPSRLVWRHHRVPILLAVTLAMFNQLSGINAILYYLNDIFAAAGFSRVSADLQAVAIGATNLAFTVVGMAIIDKVGRKVLLLAGAAGTAVCLAGTALIMGGGGDQGWLLWMLVGFIAFFALSQGAVVWVYISEIFPTPVRARGQGLGSATHWLTNALVSALFPLVAAHLRAAPFGFFAAMMVVQFFAVWRYFPETKGVTLEEIGERMGS